MRRFVTTTMIGAVVLGAALGAEIPRRGTDAQAQPVRASTAPHSAVEGMVRLPPCQREDSHNCIWLADEVGNGAGVSFIDYNGSVFYLDHDFDYVP